MKTAPGEQRGDAYLLIAQALRAEMARRRMTQESLAVLTGLSLATVGRTLRGKFRPETILLIESKLDVPLRGGASTAATVAATEFGSYHYDAVAHLTGDYLCARRSFSKASHLALYPITIRWMNMSRKILERHIFTERHAPHCEGALVHVESIGVDVPRPQGDAGRVGRRTQPLGVPDQRVGRVIEHRAS